MEQRGTRRLFWVTEAAKHKISVPRAVGLYAKRLRRSELKKLMKAEG